MTRRVNPGDPGQTRRIDLDGDAIEHVWYSPADPPDAQSSTTPIIFLHHGFGCVADWKTFPAKVARATGRPALVYSRRGCGGSSPLRKPRSTNYLHEEARHFLPLLLYALGVDQCHLYGHSDGATIALLFASAFPERTLSAVVEAPHVFAEKVTLDGVAALATRYKTDRSLRQKLGNYHRDPDGAFQAWSRTWLLPEFRSWTIVDELDTLRLPLLVIQGGADPYGTMEHARLIVEHAGIAPSLLALAASGHNPHVDAEAVTLKAVTDFFLTMEGDRC